MAVNIDRFPRFPETSRSTGLSTSHHITDLTHSSSIWSGDLFGKIASRIKSAWD